MTVRKLSALQRATLVTMDEHPDEKWMRREIIENSPGIRPTNATMRALVNCGAVEHTKGKDGIGFFYQITPAGRQAIYYEHLRGAGAGA